MREELLHFVWKYRSLPAKGLKTTGLKPLRILQPGDHNMHSGPDFFNAQLEIGGQLWAGNVEIHIKASDWYLHNHENDARYDSVILHVVWEDDVAVFRKDQTRIPALELKYVIAEKILRTYRRLLETKRLQFINCEKDIGDVSPFVIAHWLERLYFERLEKKTMEIDQMLAHSRNDWEQVFFMQLLKNFGLHVNGAAFQAIGKVLNVPIIRKVGFDLLRLESLFFGVAGLLDMPDVPDKYYLGLREEYQYLRKRFALDMKHVPKPEFSRLRPANFPTLRLSQFATLYAKQGNIFSTVIKAASIKEIYALFKVSASSYWDTHYTFGQPSGSGKKMLSRKFIDLLMINTVLPVKFCYARSQGRNADTEILGLLSGMAPERNRIVNRFASLGLPCSNGMDSQGLLQLYREYCSKNRCLYCAVGCRLLRGK